MDSNMNLGPVMQCEADLLEAVTCAACGLGEHEGSEAQLLRELIARVCNEEINSFAPELGDWRPHHE